ncbi:MAG: ClpX C4-type zinc finger protein [Sulfuricaulis sp.]
MKALKVSKNGEHVATASIEALDWLEANMQFEEGRENPVLRIQGYKKTDSGISNYLWADVELSFGNVVTVEYVNSETQDKPPHELHSENKGPHCLFCKKPSSEVGELFALSPNRAGICPVCVSSFAASMKK